MVLWPFHSIEKQTEVIMFSFSREKTARNAYSFWFLKIRFRQALTVAARGSTAFSFLISVLGGCCGRKAGVHVAVPGPN